MKNLGIKIRKPKKQDFRFGALSEDAIELNPSGDWTDYLPDKELQHFDWGDTLGCVTWSALNSLETLLKFKYGIDINMSDRFTAKMSGTTKNGNYLTKVGDSLRHDGFVLEENYPSEATSWDDFYKEISEEIIQGGKDNLKRFEIFYEWVSPFRLEEALKVAPIQIVVHAWERPVDGIYQRTDKGLNHAVLLYNSTPDYWEIYDHYDNTHKKLAKDFKIGYAFRYSINKINMKFKKEKDNSAVYLIKGDEAIAINDAQDYLNLEADWSNVEEVDKIAEIKVNKKLYTFIR